MAIKNYEGWNLLLNEKCSDRGYVILYTLWLYEDFRL